MEAEVLIDKIQALSPKDENQGSMKTQAMSIAWVVGQTHWLQYARQAVSISMPLLVTLVFWLVAIFVSFGLFAPRNAAVIVCMFISAASVSGAILMILEMMRLIGDSCSFQAPLCAQLLRSWVDRAGFIAQYARQALKKNLLRR